MASKYNWARVEDKYIFSAAESLRFLNLLLRQTQRRWRLWKFQIFTNNFSARKSLRSFPLAAFNLIQNVRNYFHNVDQQECKMCSWKLNERGKYKNSKRLLNKVC